jgi:hypothetical protein
MGFFSKIISATVKTFTIPIAVVKDVVNVATDKPANSTEKLVDSITKDIEKSVDKII